MVDTEVISTQEELMNRLKDEGFDVTQATVSRDIKTLGLIKTTDSSGNYRYTVVKGADNSMENKFINVLSNSVTDVLQSGNIVALKCYSGMASAAAAALDSMKNNNVLASIAGDDTIFVLCKDNDAAEEYSVFCKKYLSL